MKIALICFAFAAAVAMASGQDTVRIVQQPQQAQGYDPGHNNPGGLNFQIIDAGFYRPTNPQIIDPGFYQPSYPPQNIDPGFYQPSNPQIIDPGFYQPSNPPQQVIDPSFNQPLNPNIIDQAFYQPSNPQFVDDVAFYRPSAAPSGGNGQTNQGYQGQYQQTPPEAKKRYDNPFLRGG